MYQSPIEILTNSFIKEQAERLDNEILYRATMETGIDIDRDELVKALQYDRNQYEKGYLDGIRAFAERLKNHRIKPEFPWDDFYVTEGYIDHLVNEMLKGGVG